MMQAQLHLPRPHDLSRAATLAPPARGPVGHGEAFGHHGEILQGVFEGPRGERMRALVTLPLPTMITKAEFHSRDLGPHQHVDRQPGTVRVWPTWKRKARLAGELMLREHLPGATGDLVIRSGQRPGLGLGTSTSDVTAALHAIADCYALDVPPAEIARLAVRAEGASDSVMLGPRPVLFAQRRGLTLETFQRPLPPMLVVGCDTDPERGGVDTLKMPPAGYTEAEIGDFRCLRGLLRHALATGSTALVARVAHASARMNQRHLATRGFDVLQDVAARTGGLGVQVSHSGTVAGVLFDATDPDAEGLAEKCRTLLDTNGFHHTWILSTRTPEDGHAHQSRI